MTGIDTNVLVRFLTHDEPGQYERSKSFLTLQCTSENPAFLHPIVLCELVLVLKAAYKYGREEIAMALENILQTRQIEIGDRDAVRVALASNRSSNADFADSLIARLNSDAGCEKTVTFDEVAGRIDGFRFITPLMLPIHIDTDLGRMTNERTLWRLSIQTEWYVMSSWRTLSACWALMRSSEIMTVTIIAGAS